MGKPPVKKKRDGLSDQVKLFIEALIAVPNVTRAYRLAYPRSTPASACVSGHRLLRNARIKEAVELGRKTRLDRHGINADEAMQRISLIGRVDIRLLYDHEGKMLSVQDWPEELALAVRGFENREFGAKVLLESRLAALELIAKAGGKFSARTDVKVDVLALLLEHATPEDRVKARP